MSDCIITYTSIARELSSLWISVGNDRAISYIGNTCPDLPPVHGTIEKLYIARCQDGNIAELSTSSLISEWWVVDEHGLESIKPPDRMWYDDEFELSPAAYVRFFASGDSIVLWEVYSIGVRIFKFGKLAVEPGWLNGLQATRFPWKLKMRGDIPD
jgi:hypothetical protein